MEPDGTTKISFYPDPGDDYWQKLSGYVRELGETPTFRLPPLPPPRPKNWRPWHEHTLPNRRRR